MIIIDAGKVTVSERGALPLEYDIGTPEAFRILTKLWLRSGWDTKHVYSFTWLGRPMIQLPEDMIRLQEVIFTLQPDLIVETGVAHGGSLAFYASLCKLMGKGRVVGVDVEIRAQNREAIESHGLASLITLIEGDSTDPETIARVKENIPPRGTVLVLLDSCHTKEHVRRELESYGPMVTPGSYIVAMDGIMEQIVGAPRTKPDWSWNNPRQATLEFAAAHPEFALVEPPFLFNEGIITERVSYWPNAFLLRKHSTRESSKEPGLAGKPTGQDSTEGMAGGAT
jgi:cephalosporin hydroxylase